MSNLYNSLWDGKNIDFEKALDWMLLNSNLNVINSGVIESKANQFIDKRRLEENIDFIKNIDLKSI